MARYVVEEKMKRFFVDSVCETPVLDGEIHKHLSVVLRAKVGDEVVLCCGDGYDYICRITSVSRTETKLSLCRKERNESEPTVRVTLFMSIMKGDKNDLVVQKAVELGAYAVYPVYTEFVQGYDRNVRTDRLNKIALEAAKQCGRSVLTKVYSPINFSETVGLLSEFDTVVFPYEKAITPSLKEFLQARKRETDICNVAVLIGSEGGFSDAEAQMLAQNGVVSVTLGKRILRAETANIAVLSVIMYELGQWQ